MVGMGGGGGDGTPLQALLCFIAYATLNLFLNYFNKWVVSTKGGGGFVYPVFYSMWHMVASVAGSLVMMKIKPPKTGLPSVQQFLDYKWGLIILAICSTVNIVCNNSSLMYIGIFVNQIIKALAPLLTMTCSFFVLKRRYHWKIILVVLVLCTSAMFAVPFADPSVTALGVTLVSVATLASSTKPVFGEMLMTSTDKPKLDPNQLVFYDCLLSFFFMFVLWLATELKGSIGYLGAKPGLAISIILAGSLAAFTYNFVVYYYTKVASAMSLIVSTNLIKVALITSSAIIENVRNIGNWIAIAVFFISVIAYAYITWQLKQKKPAAAAAPGAAAPAASTTSTSGSGRLFGLFKPKPTEESKLLQP